MKGGDKRKSGDAYAEVWHDRPREVEHDSRSSPGTRYRAIVMTDAPLSHSGRERAIQSLCMLATVRSTGHRVPGQIAMMGSIPGPQAAQSQSRRREKREEM
jgi:hypothetical protein